MSRCFENSEASLLTVSWCSDHSLCSVLEVVKIKSLGHCELIYQHLPSLGTSTAKGNRAGSSLM